jgi:hypothetical protein
MTSSTAPATQWYELKATVYTYQLPQIQPLSYYFLLDNATGYVLQFVTACGKNVLLSPSGIFDTYTYEFSFQGISIYDTSLPLSSESKLQYVFPSYYLTFSTRQIEAYTSYPTQGYDLSTRQYCIFYIDGSPPFQKPPHEGRWYSIPPNKKHTEQLIQNTVRMPASLYMDNLSTTCCVPKLWNQSSDQAEPAVQRTSTSGTNSVRGTVTRCRPNAGCPGGKGCDIKFNSYARYLGRLKGKKK